MGFNFPDAPAINDTFSAGSFIYKFNGTGWTVLSTSEAYVQKTGDTMSGHLALPTGPAAANAVRKDYVDAADGALSNSIATNTADIATNTANINTVATNANSRVLKSGDTMTGDLTINTGVLRLVDTNHYLWWNGTEYNLGAKGNIWHQGNFNPANYQPVGSYFPVAGGTITGQVGITVNSSIPLYIRTNNVNTTPAITVGRSDNELYLAVQSSAGGIANGTVAGDGMIAMPFAGKLCLSIGTNGNMIFANGGIGLGGSHNTNYRFYGNSHGLSMQGPDTSTTKNFISFADSALTGVGAIVGNMSAHTTAYTTSSDERFKPNRAKITAPEARNVIDQLEVYDFDKDGNQIRGFGVIAQQAYAVHKSLALPPQLEGDVWMVEKAAPVPFLISALQGANANIDRLQDTIRALEQRLATLEAKVSQ